MRKINWGKSVLLGILLSMGQGLFAQELKDDKGYKEQLAAIETQLKRGDIANALQSIEETLANYPEGAELFYAKSLLYAQARNFEVAIPAAEQAVQNAPDNMLYSNHLLELYKGSGDLKSAIALLDQVLAKHANNPQIYREKIMLLHSAKQSDEALKIYDLSKEKFGESDTLDVLKAEILMDLKKPTEAVEVLQKWRQQKSAIRQVYSSLSYIFVDEGKAKDAITVLNEGLQNSKDDLLYLDLADAYTALGKKKEAFDNLKKAFESPTLNYFDKHRTMFTVLGDPDKFTIDQKQELANILVLKHPRIADSHMFKGDVLWMKGSYDEARSLYLTTLGMQPQHVDAWRKLISMEIANNQLDQAINDGNEALRHNPGNVMLTYFVGLAHMMKKDNDTARKYLEAALDQSGNEAVYLQSLIYGSLGDLYHEIKMPSASDAAYDEAIKLDSNNASVMNNYAYYLSLRKEKLDLAEQHAKRANEIDTRSGTFQDTYAWVLFQQSKYKEALFWIEQAVKNSKPSAVLLDHYGDILMKLGKGKDAVKQWEKALSIAGDNAVDKDKIKQKISEKKYIE